MQHALVDPQRAVHQGIARVHFYQPPTPQRGGRRERAPVRRVEPAQCQCKRQLKRRWIYFRRRGQHEQITLEGGEAQAGG